jgi:Tfp pilus assembly PilM family ATPase
MRPGRFSLWRAQAPTAAVEFTSTRVTGVSMDVRGGQPVISTFATEALPEGALAPSLTTDNIQDRPAVGAALGLVLERIGRPRRVGLVLPDPVVKVSIVKFEQVPSRSDDLEQLIRWQMRKAAPFAIEEAQVSYVPGNRDESGQDFVVTVARRDLIEGYENLCGEAKAHAGLVDISTFNVVNAVLASAIPPRADWLLVNVAEDYASIAVLRGAHPIFFRSRTASDDETLSDLVHQTAMYYEDRLHGAGFGDVLLSGAFAAGTGPVSDVEDMRRSLEARLKTTVSIVDPRLAAGFGARLTTSPVLLDALTPLVGLLVREKDAAA